MTSLARFLCYTLVFFRAIRASCDLPADQDSLREDADATGGHTVNESPPQAPRLVAIGDLHGDYENALRTLRLSGVVDESGTWIGGHAHLVQTGDLVDRGPNSTQVLDLFQRLSAEALRAGGRVTCLLGNHELMNLQGDLRYVASQELQRVGEEAQPPAHNVREAKAAWAHLFTPAGKYGALLRDPEQRQVAVVAGEGTCRSLFVHAGLLPGLVEKAPGGLPALEALNQEIMKEVAGTHVGRGRLLGEQGPLWHRGLVQSPARRACPLVERSLEALQAHRMVVGHTVQDRGISTRCSGALHMIDVGISRAYNGLPAVWQCVPGSGITAFYEDRDPVELQPTHQESRDAGGGSSWW